LLFALVLVYLTLLLHILIKKLMGFMIKILLISKFIFHFIEILKVQKEFEILSILVVNGNFIV